jgi:hypothetical protein
MQPVERPPWMIQLDRKTWRMAVYLAVMGTTGLDNKMREFQPLRNAFPLLPATASGTSPTNPTADDGSVSEGVVAQAATSPLDDSIEGERDTDTGEDGSEASEDAEEHGDGSDSSDTSESEAPDSPVEAPVEAPEAPDVPLESRMESPVEETIHSPPALDSTEAPKAPDASVEATIEAPVEAPEAPDVPLDCRMESPVEETIHSPPALESTRGDASMDTVESLLCQAEGTTPDNSGPTSSSATTQVLQGEAETQGSPVSATTAPMLEQSATPAPANGFPSNSMELDLGKDGNAPLFIIKETPSAFDIDQILSTGMVEQMNMDLDLATFSPSVDPLSTMLNRDMGSLTLTPGLQPPQGVLEGRPSQEEVSVLGEEQEVDPRTATPQTTGEPSSTNRAPYSTESLTNEPDRTSDQGGGAETEQSSEEDPETEDGSAGEGDSDGNDGDSDGEGDGDDGHDPASEEEESADDEIIISNHGERYPKRQRITVDYKEPKVIRGIAPPKSRGGGASRKEAKHRQPRVPANQRTLDSMVYQAPDTVEHHVERLPGDQWLQGVPALPKVSSFTNIYDRYLNGDSSRQRT